MDIVTGKDCCSEAVQVSSEVPEVNTPVRQRNSTETISELGKLLQTETGQGEYLL